MAFVLPKDAENVEVVWCYCCEAFTRHEVFQGDPTHYQCDCGCSLDDSEDEIIYPENKTAPTVEMVSQHGVYMMTNVLMYA